MVIDWTEFDADDQATLVASLVTSHGRSTPLIWLTVWKDELENAQSDYEDAVLRRLWEVLPPDVAVTILADRSFGDRKLMGFLEELGFDYVIRIRGNITVEAANGETRKSAQWVGSNGRARKLSNARITRAAKPVPAVVCVHAKGMKEPWCLVTSKAEAKTAEIKRLYARRWTTDIDQTWRLSRLNGWGTVVVEQRRPAVPGRWRCTYLLEVGDRGCIGLDKVGMTAADGYAPAAQTPLLDPAV